MELRVEFMSIEPNGYIYFSSSDAGLEDIDAARAECGIDFDAKLMCNEIKWYREPEWRIISEAEARSFGGFERSFRRKVTLDGDYSRFKKTKYAFDRDPKTDAITSVNGSYCLDSEALFEAWKAAGCPDTLTIAEI